MIGLALYGNNSEPRRRDRKEMASRKAICVITLTSLREPNKSCAVTGAVLHWHACMAAISHAGVALS